MDDSSRYRREDETTPVDRMRVDPMGVDPMRANPAGPAPIAPTHTDPALARPGFGGPAVDPTPADRRTAPTADQLRADIDSGRTHDKVAHADPAAAPLGTDDEAAGTPPTPGQIATARRQEGARDVPHQPSASRVETRTASRPNSTIMWAVIAVVAVAVILAFMF